MTSAGRERALPAGALTMRGAAPVVNTKAGVARMAWFKRFYGRKSYEPEQERLAQLHLRLGGPRGMLMLCTGSAAKTTVFIALDPLLAATHFPEFEPSEMPPRDATLLFGDSRDIEAFRGPKNS